jgi:hypothetical protein
MVVGAISFNNLEKKSVLSIPVGLENARNPLGHSGQRKLQDVVGSIEILIGCPQ